MKSVKLFSVLIALTMVTQVFATKEEEGELLQKMDKYSWYVTGACGLAGAFIGTRNYTHFNGVTTGVGLSILFAGLLAGYQTETYCKVAVTELTESQAASRFLRASGKFTIMNLIGCGIGYYGLASLLKMARS